MADDMRTPLIEVNNLDKFFKVPQGVLKAVNHVSFKIEKGKTLGVVGESGCGKSTLGKTIIRILEPTSGEIKFNGKSVMNLSKKEEREFQRNAQIIFQDPNASINPRMSVADSIADPLKVAKMFKTKSEVQDKVAELMNTVGLAERVWGAYPHELDGGRLQRVGIARALALNPEFIVCDEPVSALDVSIQAQILNLLMDLQDERKLTYMFITHDLSVVRHISDDIMVMYLGKCVEKAPKAELFDNPLHPYTKALLSAIPLPTIEARHQKAHLIKGELTSPINPAPGCAFAARCEHVCEKCVGHDIPLTDLGGGHYVSCVLFNKETGEE